MCIQAINIWRIALNISVQLVDMNEIDQLMAVYGSEWHLVC